jgi:hypothetical protein
MVIFGVRFSAALAGGERRSNRLSAHIVIQTCAKFSDNCAMAGTGPTPGSSSPNPDDINDRLAEIAAELAAEAMFKEPAAADRAHAPVRVVARAASGRRGGPLRRWRDKRLAAELRKPLREPGGQQPPAPEPKTSRRASDPRPKASRRAAGAAQRAGAWPTPDRGYATPTRRRGGGRSLLTLILVLVVLFGISAGLRKLLQRNPSGTGRATAGSSRTPGGSRPGATPARSSPLPTPAFSVASPFAGSPAASFPDGAAGIVLPPSRPVGPYTSAQVASAFVTVKNLLVAANLNVATLQGSRPTAFGSLLTSQQRSWFYEHLTKPVRPKNARPWLTRAWVTSFAAGTELVGSIIKVHGAPMTAKVVTVSDRPALQITANYLFVYPVEQQGQPGSRLRVVAHEFATVQFAQWYDPGGSLQPWISGFGDSYAGVQCGTTDGFVHPAFPLLGPGKVRPSGPPVDPYNLAQRPKGCQPVTST